MELEILQGQYTNATDNNSGKGSNLSATSEEKMEAKVPTSLMSQVNEDCYDDDSKKKMSPVLALLMPKNLSACSPMVANRSTGDYLESPVPGTRSRKLTQFLYSSPMEDECTHKITPPNINDVNTCTMFFHDNQSYLLGLLVETVETSTCSARTPVHKLVFVPDNFRNNYFIFNDTHMPLTTQHTSIMDTECIAISSSKSINVVPKYCIFQYPIKPTSPITTVFKITCQQLLPIQSSNNSSSTNLEETARESIYKIVCNGQFTDCDYDGTKIDEWFGPKHIDLHLSWLLHTNRICNKSLDDIMILPYTIFREFDEDSDNKNGTLTSSMYDDLVLKQKQNIFDAKIFCIYFSGLLLVVGGSC